MSEFDGRTEPRLLRLIDRKRKLRDLALLVPTLMVWWWSFHWIEHRFQIPDEPARVGSILILAVVVGLASPYLGWGVRRDRQETSRLRWLLAEKSARLQSLGRRLLILGMSCMLLERLAALVLERRPVPPGSSLDLVPICLVAVGQIFRWRLATTMDELDRAYVLEATRLAYVVTVSLLILGLCLGRLWPDCLPSLVTIALLAGALAYVVGLAALEARAAPRDG